VFVIGTIASMIYLGILYNNELNDLKNGSGLKLNAVATDKIQANAITASLEQRSRRVPSQETKYKTV
jgi:hypothetical protein